MNGTGKFWFLHDGKDRLGPITLEEAVNRLEGHPPGTEYFAWCQGMTDWKRASEIEALQNALVERERASRNTASEPPPSIVSEPLAAAVELAATAFQAEAETAPAQAMAIEVSPSSASTGSVENDGLSAMIEVRPAPKDDHTGSLDAGELRNARKEAARTTKSSAAAKAREEGRLPARTRLLLTSFAIVALGGIGYSAWPLLIRPEGIVSRWLTRLPDTPELTGEQRNLLQAAASSGAASPSSAPVELVLAGSRKDSPVAYLAANLPDSSSLNITFQANPSLITAASPTPVRLTVELIHRLGHSDPIREVDGAVLPRGEYQATVTDSEGRTRLSRQVWIGADRDDAFNKDLARYQQDLRGRAQNELQNLKDAAAKLTAIIDGDSKAAAETAVAKNAALRARMIAAWTASRAKILDDLNAILLPEGHYFKSARNAALSLREAIQSQETAEFSFPGSLGAPSPQASPVSADDAARRTAQAQADLAARLADADHKLSSSTGYLEEEK